MLRFAPTQSGKGVGLVVPTLVDLARRLHCDIKGENWTLTNGTSAAYNPLLEVRHGEWEVRDVQNVADVLVDPEGSLERRNHWEKTSHALPRKADVHLVVRDGRFANQILRIPSGSGMRAVASPPHEQCCVSVTPVRPVVRYLIPS